MISIFGQVIICILTRSSCDYCTFNDAGIRHQVGVVACKCEAFSVTLSRLRLWPTSSKQPSYALAFELLDWMEAMLLECQVSLNDFCKALNNKLPSYVVVSKKKHICHVLKDHKILGIYLYIVDNSLVFKKTS